MLTTPFGPVVLTMDQQPVPYQWEPIPIDTSFPEVDGAFLIHHDFINDGKPHTLCCQLENAAVEGCMESGQWQEGLSLYMGQSKLTISCEGDFMLPLANGYDFDGYYERSGICLRLNEHTASRSIRFGVAWLMHCTPENEVQTWLATDVHRLHPIDRTGPSSPVKVF